MLLLVFTHRHVRRLIQQHVGGLQNGIGKQRNARAFAVLAGLVLELGHPVEPTHPRRARQQPLQLRMGRNARLIEQDCLIGIQPAGEQRGCHLAGVCGQLLGHMRHRNGMQIREEIQAFHFILHLHPVADRAQIIAEMKVASWLNTRNDAHRIYSLAEAAGAVARLRKRDFNSLIRYAPNSNMASA